MSHHIVDLGSDDDENLTTEASEEESDMEESESSDYSDVQGDADLKEQLRWCLDDVQHEGSFSSSRQHSLYPNPGLYITGLGFVGLPLSDRDAKAVAGLCKRSPFGRREKTVVDEEVRKTWELDASQVECRNPEWTIFQRAMVDQAVTDMGVKISANAQPYKLLLYEKGAFFKTHRDTEKVPGMFGTMVVCLPSKHTGGEVNLTQGNKQQVLQTAATSAYDVSTLAWYSDVQHEIRPVLSGYRLVLTYNLVQDQSAPEQTAAAQEANHETLERLLRAWNRNFDHRGYFVYPLSFKYTESTLCQTSLKGSDAAKGRYLDQVCAREGVYWFLAHMVKQKEEEEYYGYGDGGGENEERVFRWMCMPDGTSINLGGMHFIEADALLVDEDSLYGDRDPDSEDEGEYTGNESMPATHRYHDTVMVLMRRDDVLSSFKLAQSHSPDSLLAYYSLVCADTGDDLRRRRDGLTMILDKAIEFLSTADDDASSSTSYALSFDRDEQELKRTKYAKAFETIAEFCYSSGHGDIVSDILRATVRNKTWATSKGLVGLVARQVATEASNGREDVWDDWLSTGLPSPCTYAYAKEQETTYNAIRTVLPATSIPSFDEWKRARVEQIIRGVRYYSREDAQAIVDLIPNVAPQIYFESIVPTLIQNPDGSGLSRLLFLLAENGVMSQEQIVKPTYKRLAHTASAALKLPVATVATPAPYLYDRKPEMSRAEELFEIIENYLKLGLGQEGVQLLEAGLPDVPGVTSDLWKNWKLLFDFVGSLIELLSRYHDYLHQQAEPFIRSVFHTAVEHFANRRPSNSPNWVMSKASRGYSRGYNRGYSRSYESDKCDCAPCKALEAFLIDPKERVGKFRYNERIRSHLQYELDSMDFKFETERGRSPYALIITKTQNRRLREIQEWKDTISAVRTELQNFDTLLKPLGISATDMADMDTQLTEAGTSEGALQSNQRVRPGSTSSKKVPARRQAAGVKRKSDVVDLTED